MKKHLFVVALLGILFNTNFLQANPGEEKYPTIELGATLPAATVKMKDISGSMTSLKEQVKSNGLLVMFSCNTCPFVVMWEDRYDAIS